MIDVSRRQRVNNLFGLQSTCLRIYNQTEVKKRGKLYVIIGQLYDLSRRTVLEQNGGKYGRKMIVIIELQVQVSVVVFLFI